MAGTPRSPRSDLPLRPLCCALALVFGASPALAEDAETRLADVVVTAAGFEQKITDAPASISVISKEELTRKPYVSLVDAVRELEGVDVGETTDKTGQRTISMRGMGADYTLVLIDGKRQNNHGDIYPNSFGGNQFNHVPPLDAIERIEVIRGPASTLYGADALGGVINIITKKDAKEWTGSVTVSRLIQEDRDFGDASTVDFSARGPIKPGTLSMAVRGSRYHRHASDPALKSKLDPDGNPFTPSLGFGGGGRTVDNINEALGFSLYLTPTDNQRITFEYDTSRQRYDNEESQLGTVDSIDTIWRASGSGSSRRADPRVGYLDEQKFTRESWSLSHEGKWDFGNSYVALSYIESDNKGRTLPFTVAERQELIELIDGTGPYSGMSLDDRRALAESMFLPRPKRTLQSSQYTLDAKLDIPVEEMLGSHLFVVGGQIVRGRLKDGVFGMESGRPGKVQKHDMWALFAEDNWMMTDKFTLTAGVRHDQHKMFGSNISPRVYGTYAIDPQWTLKGGISTGYKTPKTTDLYDGVTGFGGQGTSPMYGNPDLKPEKSRNSELALYWNHPARHNFNITVFRNDFKDKISSQPCGPATPYECSSSGDYEDLGYASSNKKVNIDKAVIKGIEVAGRWQIAERWALRGNYTYTDSEQKSGADKGMPLTQTSKHMYNATLDWQPLPKLDVYLTMEKRSKRYRGKVNDEPAYYKAYQIFHLGAIYRVTDQLTISGRINNLLDKDFTTYDIVDNGSGGWTTRYHYNNIDARRNLWISANYRF